MARAALADYSDDMAWIRTLNDDEATGPIARLFDAARQRTGKVANVVRLMGLDAKSAQGSMSFYTNLMKSDNALDAARREMLGAVVSVVNECHY